jgi:hypothetical protein
MLNEKSKKINDNNIEISPTLKYNTSRPTKDLENKKTIVIKKDTYIFNMIFMYFSLLLINLRLNQFFFGT